jgi:hypothetical protein
MANNFFGNFNLNFPPQLGDLFKPAQQLGPQGIELTTEKPGPASNADPNIAVNDSNQSGLDMNTASSPRDFGVFRGINDLINNSLMQRGNGWFEYQATRWSKNFYYRFVIFEVSTSGMSGAPSYTPVASFKLPINPQNIQITTPFASKLTVTSDGIYEEHNGIPIKEISISGTTGVLPNRKAVGQADGQLSPFGQLASAVAPNTVRAISQTVSSVQNLISSFDSVLNNTQGSGQNTSEAILTGYGQFHLMRLFLEGYAALKISKGGNKYRLALHMPKDNITYLIKPGQFTMSKSIDSPMEYRYAFSATAWGTIQNFGSKARESQGLNQFNILKGKVLDVLLNTRRTLSQFRNTLQAVKSDYAQTVAGPLNLAILALKDIGGVGKTMVDYGGELGSFVKSVSPTIIIDVDRFPSIPASTKQKVKGAKDDLLSTKNSSDRQTLQPVVGGSSGTVGNSVSFSQDQGVNVDSATLFEVMDSVNVSAIPLTSGQLQVVNQFDEQARLIRRKDYEILIGNLDKLQQAIEATEMDESKFDIDYALNDSKIHLFSLIADNSYDDQFTVKSLQFWKVKANASGMTFQDSSSKFSVPFPLSGTLEWIAQTYLGDPTRWIEIAALNNLQAPYVDEDGFERSFLSNGSENQFNVSSVENLFVGQAVLISSDSQFPSARKILIIKEISPNNFLIQVDGEDNLSDFTAAENAKMKAYLPYTTNSAKRIYIPSPQTSLVPEESTRPISSIPDSDLVRFAKVDLLLTQDGDLSLSSDGFANLAFGANNLVQAARLKLVSTLSSVLGHPEYGNPFEVGEVTANITPSKVKEQLNSAFESDPRFLGIDQFRLEINNGTAKLDLTTNLTFGNSVLPLSFNLN